MIKTPRRRPARSKAALAEGTELPLQDTLQDPLYEAATDNNLLPVVISLGEPVIAPNAVVVEAVSDYQPHAPEPVQHAPNPQQISRQVDRQIDGVLLESDDLSQDLEVPVVAPAAEYEVVVVKTESRPPLERSERPDRSDRQGERGERDRQQNGQQNGDRHPERNGQNNGQNSGQNSGQNNGQNADRNNRFKDRKDRERQERFDKQNNRNAEQQAFNNYESTLASQLAQGVEVKTLSLMDLKKRSTAELLEMAESHGLDVARTKKQDLIFALMREAARRGEQIVAEGVLELTSDGQHGFLRTADSSYLAGVDDVYVAPPQIKRFHLRTGDTILGKVRPPKESERYFCLYRLDSINFEPPEASRKKVSFENLTPLFADKRFKMERGNGSTEDITARVIDIVSPFGKGQRGLVIAPPKAGKTVMLQNIAQSLVSNYPNIYLIVLLIDERPEEVTEMQRTVRGEVVASTFDEPAARHVQVAEMVIEKAKRLVEHKKDVVILLDSITRLARAYNTVAPNSGKILSGGVDANALQKPKRFFGAARNVEEGGSLTILATALVDTGSKMDEVIYEEFKGTGNMEVHLDRRISEKRLFPAIHINRSGTRKEELLVEPAELQKTWVLRKVLHGMDELAAMELLFDRLRSTKTNEAFFEAMRRN
jgi:transcription termination factor Rho